MGFARTILEGRYGEDPFYLGEAVWYPPLVHSLLALITKLSGASLHVVSVRSGAYLDLLAPAAFYLLVLRWADAPTALFAAIAFLLLGPHELCSCDGDATYSPWLWPDNFAQALGYLALAAALAWRSRRTTLRAALTGVALGVTALGHSAPASMAAGIITIVTLVDLARDLREGRPEDGKSRFLQLVLIAGVAMLVTLPFTYHLLANYRGAIRNWEGVGWQHAHHQLSGFRLLLQDQVSVRGALALLGLSFLGTRHAIARPKSLVLAWPALALGGIAWGYLHEWARPRGYNLPILFSSWHFALYLQAAESLLAGLALAGLTSKLSRARPERLSSARFVLALVLCGFGLHHYSERADLATNREHAVWRAEREHEALSAWILENTSSNDVFLASARQAMFTVAPTARKVLVLPRDFANPYVDPKPREALQRALLEAPAAEFRRLALENGIRFIILGPGGIVEGEGQLKAMLERPRWMLQRFSALRDGPERTRLGRLGEHLVECPWALTTCEPPGGRVRIYEILAESAADGP